MNKVNVSIEIMGKTYQIKCPETEVDSLKKAARLLEEKMDNLRDHGSTLSTDKIAVIASLNLAHQIFLLEQTNYQATQTIHERLQDLHRKVDAALAENAQMELASAE